MRFNASTRRVRYCLLLAILALLAQAHRAFADQQLACITILSGETATSLAQRISGDGRHAGEPWFQIVNPATSEFVSKGSYDRILPGWKACVTYASQAVAAAPPGPSAAQMVSSLIDWRTVVVLWGATMLSLGVACRCTGQYVKDRERTLCRMKIFADRFVQEFERPLTDRHETGRPIESQVRFSPARSRVEVLFAPNGGRRYPNLTDHRMNLLYDVGRVQDVVGDRGFVSRKPYVSGRWVVVPFQLTAGPKQAGAR
jgi:hypothetical protein